MHLYVFLFGLLAIFLYSPFPSGLLLVLFGNNYFMSSRNFSVFPVHLGCQWSTRQKQKAHRSVWFLLSIFELFLRQIQFRFLKQWVYVLFITVSVVPTTILLCQGTANKTLPSLVLNHQRIIA
jgi:hypothetical protein